MSVHINIHGREIRSGAVRDHGSTSSAAVNLTTEPRPGHVDDMICFFVDHGKLTSSAEELEKAAAALREIASTKTYTIRTDSELMTDIEASSADQAVELFTAGEFATVGAFFARIREVGDGATAWIESPDGTRQEA